MKHLLLLLPLLMLASCAQEAPAAETFTCPDGTVVDSLDDCPPEPSDDEPDEPAEVIAPEPEPADEPSPNDVFKGSGSADTDVFSGGEATSAASAELESLIERVEDKASSGYSFRYSYSVGGSSPATFLQLSRVTYDWERYGVELADDAAMDGEPVTHVVVDPDSATAYCVDCRETVEPFPVDASEFSLRLPHEWLSSLSDAEFTGEQSIHGRKSYRITGSVDGEDVLLFADKFTGLPVQVESGDRVFNYRDIRLGASGLSFV